MNIEKSWRLTHLFRNPRHNGKGRRYFMRSCYVPHVGMKQMRKAAERRIKKDAISTDAI